MAKQRTGLTIWTRTLAGAAALGAVLLASTLAPIPEAQAADFVVYSIYQSVDLGDPKTPPQRDFYLNMGAAHGVREGMTIEVSRRVPTYDVISEKLYQDVTFPIARLKIIHVESTAAIARMDKMLPLEKTPAISPRAVMVGDLVKVVP